MADLRDLARAGALAIFAALLGAAQPHLPGLPTGAQLSDAFLVVAAAASLWALRREEAARLARDPLPWCGLAYVGCALLSAAAHGAGFTKVAGIAMLVAVLVVALLVGREAGGRDLVLRGWIAGAAALCTIGLFGSVLALLGVPSTLYSPRGGDLHLPFRPQGLCATSNLLAAIAVPPLLLLLHDGARLVGRRGRAPLLGLIGATLVLTLSRSLVAAALGILWLRLDDARAAGRIEAPRARRFAIAGGALALAAIAVAFRADVYRDSRGLVLSAGPGLRQRVAAAALESIAASPLAGVGPTEAPAALHWPRPEDPVQRVDAHVTWLNVPATLGFPALAPFAALIALALARSRRRRGLDRTAAALSVALVAVVFDSLSVDVEDFRSLWLLVGLASAPGVERRVAVVD